jgi:hypothetical protein
MTGVFRQFWLIREYYMNFSIVLSVEFLSYLIISAYKVCIDYLSYFNMSNICSIHMNKSPSHTQYNCLFDIPVIDKVDSTNKDMF